MKTFRCLVLICLVLFSVSCSSQNEGTPQTGSEYPQTDKNVVRDEQPWDGPVEVYLYNPSKEYEEVGIVSTQGSTKEPLTCLFDDLQEKAASIGANGIFVQTARTRGAASKETGVIKLTATAIRIK
jgi:hypothetical protein